MTLFKNSLCIITALIVSLMSVFTVAQSSSSSSSSNSSACNGQAVVPIISPDNLPPSADFTATVQGPTVFIDARTSTDPNGDRLRYSIKFGGEKTIGQSNAWHTFRSAGDHTITVSVFDGQYTDTSSQVISVTEYVSGNRAPIAMVAILSHPYSISADFSASFDEDGDALTYAFSFDQRDAVVTSNPKAAGTSHNGVPIPVVVTVTDGSLGDTQEILAPAVCGLTMDNAGVPVIDYRVEGMTVYVDARKSQHTINVAWGFGDGTRSSDLVTSHTYSAPGVYDLSLRALGFVFASEKTIRISVGELQSETAPSVAFECENDSRQTSVVCSGDGTYDADGNPLTFHIDWGDGSASIPGWLNYRSNPLNRSEISHHYREPGTYTITLTVSDGGHTVTKELVQHVSVNNQPPLACFIVMQNPIYPPPLNASFNASCSTDPDGDALSYRWEFSDGRTASGVNPSHTFAAPGSYTIKLTVSDGIKTHSISQTSHFGPVETSAAASCEYLVSNDWGSGFTGLIRITNNGTAALEGWEMSWQYSGSTRISNLWNAQLSGTNPYVARNLGWNEKIQPGQSVEFGFQGSKPPGTAEVPVVQSDLCTQ